MFGNSDPVVSLSELTLGDSSAKLTKIFYKEVDHSVIYTNERLENRPTSENRLN